MARSRRIPALLAGLVLLGVGATPPAAVRAAEGDPASAWPAVSADAAVLMDAASGRVLYAKNARLRLYPASTTKVLTALVALDRADPDALVTVSARAAATPGSSMHLRAGTRLRLRDLLYGLMLVSGNDAAEAVAEYVGGSTAAFAALMNREAARLGAADSHFTNPSGLPDPDHYTTAYDMALVARRAMADPLFRQIVAAPAHTVAFADGRRVTYVNENRLLGSDGVDGVKTGYTRQAGHTYIASAVRNGWRLIAVLLGDSKEGKYRDALALFRYGFSQYRPLRVAAPGDMAAQSQVLGGVAPYVDLTVPPGPAVQVAVRSGDTVELTADSPEVVKAPVVAGTRLGTLSLTVDGSVVGSWPLVAARSVAPTRRSGPVRTRRSAAPPPSARAMAAGAGRPDPVARLLALLQMAWVRILTFLRARIG